MGLRFCLFYKQCHMIARRQSAVWPPSAAVISDLAPLAVPVSFDRWCWWKWIQTNFKGLFTYITAQIKFISSCILVNIVKVKISLWKHKASVIVYFSFCQQIPWSDQQQCVSLSSFWSPYRVSDSPAQYHAKACNTPETPLEDTL